MVTLAAARQSAIGWRMRRPWVRRRLRAALLAESGPTPMPVWQLAREAGLDDIPNNELQHAVTCLIDAGLADGLRGRGGWWYLRAAPTHGDGDGVRAERGWPVDPATEPPTRSNPALPWPDAASSREFSVTQRVPRRRGSQWVRGLALFGVATAIAAAAVFMMVQPRDSGEAATPANREQWVRLVARDYIDGSRAGRIGFTLPEDFTEVSGVSTTASNARLRAGMEQYVRAAMFTGVPSRIGLLAWARAEFGDLPGGAAGDAWIHQASATYATRLLAGTPGYALSPALREIGGIAADERDPAALTAGLDRAIRSALYLGTPEAAGLLDWARRNRGDLPLE